VIETTYRRRGEATGIAQPNREPNMSEITQQLSSESIAVLEMIAGGSTYEQILSAYPNLAYPDIFRAASEALDVMSQRSTNKASYQMTDIRKADALGR